VTTIDFFEREVKRLQERFNTTFGQAKIVNVRARYLTIFAICWVDLIARSARKTSDEQAIGKMTREFCKKRESLNRFFDLIESQQERRRHEQIKDKHSVAAGG
jgi:hypothetical protein